MGIYIKVNLACNRIWAEQLQLVFAESIKNFYQFSLSGIIRSENTVLDFA